MGDYGLKVVNEYNNLVIDSRHPNYHLMEKINVTASLVPITYSYRSPIRMTWWSANFSTDRWFDVTFSQSYTEPPLIGFRSTVSGGALIDWKKSGNLYTGVYISATEYASSVTLDAEIFVYSTVNTPLYNDYGIICKNAEGDLVFDSNRKLLRYLWHDVFSFYGDNTWANTYCNGTRIFRFDNVGVSIQDYTFTHTSFNELPILLLTFLGRLGYADETYTTVHKFIGLRNISETQSSITCYTGGSYIKGFAPTGSLSFSTYAYVPASSPVYQTILLARD